MGDNKYHLNIKFNKEYATVRSSYQRSLANAEEGQRLRNEGKKHIDLWIEGSLYPVDPETRRYPPFHTPHDLIRFVGDGDNGLLGYCSRLVQSHSQCVQYIHSLQSTILLNETRMKELENKIVSMTLQNKHLQTLKETPIGLRERVKRMRDVQKLTKGSGQRKKRLKMAREHVTSILGFDICNAQERVEFLNEIMSRSDFLKLLRFPKNHNQKKLVF